MPGRKKGKVGRPPGPPENVRKNQITAMFTDAEVEQLGKLAERERVPVATVIHRAVRDVLGTQPKRRRRPKER